MAQIGKLAAAKREAVYFDNYLTYLNTLDDRNPNIGQGEATPPQVDLYVKPFGIDLHSTQYLVASGTASRWASYKTLFAPFTKETINEGTENVLDLSRVRPGKIVIKTGVGAKRVVTAATTRRKYTTRGGKAGAIPFGRRLAAENEQEAYSFIRAAIKASAGFNDETTKVSRIKEYI